MSEFNKVIIGNSPYDQKSLIAGLTNNLEGGLTELKGTRNSIKSDIYNDINDTSTNFAGETNITNYSLQELD